MSETCELAKADEFATKESLVAGNRSRRKARHVRDVRTRQGGRVRHPRVLGGWGSKGKRPTRQRRVNSPKRTSSPPKSLWWLEIEAEERPDTSETRELAKVDKFATQESWVAGR